MLQINSPAFAAYALTCIALCGNLIFLWAYSGATRARVKSTPNEEDVKPFGATLSDVDPPEIARVLRAHANAQAAILPFLALGLVYVLAGGPHDPAVAYFAVFTAARWLHSWAYLNGRQPLRSIIFLVGTLPLFALAGHIAWLVL